MRAATLGLLAIAIVLAGCAQKSEVDKCMDEWEKATKDTPESEEKAALRFNARRACMRAMAGSE
jgi:hypothetical protein